MLPHVLSALALGMASAFAQNTTFLAELVQTLESLGLTSLANASQAVNGTSTGQALLAELGSGPQTVFAPNNDAFVGLHPNISSDPQLLAEVLSYHVVPGTFNVTPSYPNTTVGRTLLNSSDLVFLEGNKQQVLAWSSVNGTTQILNQNTPATVINSTSVGNITLHVTNAVIDVPGEFTAALAANNLSSFQSALQSASLLDTLNYAHGITIFAPTNDAIDAIQQNLSSVESNTTLLQTVLLNHVINGTSVYSGSLIGLESSNVTTAAGEGIGATFNSSGGYVVGGNTTAKITTPDVVLWNGVLHIIDAVLLNEDSDPSAASSAVSSASAQATSSTTESGPVGFTQTASGGSAAGSGSSSSAANANANLISFNTIGFACLMSTVGAIIGGLLAL